MTFTKLRTCVGNKKQIKYALCCEAVHKYILLDVLVCSIVEYFYELCCRNIHYTLHTKTSNKLFIIPPFCTKFLAVKL